MTTSTWAVNPFNLSGVVISAGTVTKTDGTSIDTNAGGTTAPPSNEITVGDPTAPYSGTIGIQPGDSVANALQKLDVILAANVPIPIVTLASGLSTVTMTLEDLTPTSIQLYSAIPAGGTVAFSNVTNNKTNVNLAETPSILEDPGVLTLKFTAAGVTTDYGSVTLIAGASNNITISTNLSVTFDGDPNPGFPNLTDIAFKAKATQPIPTLTANNSLPYAYQLQLVPTVNPTTTTPPLSFYVDDVNVNQAPEVTDIDFITAVGTTYNYISGVPVFASTSQIRLQILCKNVIGSSTGGFYNASKVIIVGYDLDDTTTVLDDGSISSVERVLSTSIAAGTTASPLVFQMTKGLPSSQKSNYLTAVSTITADMTVLANKYTENSHPQARAYNSLGTSSALFVHSTSTYKLRIDTVSTGESTKRVVSGNALYPTFNNSVTPPVGTYGATFSGSTSLVALGNAELQMINNLFRYPPDVNYSTGYVGMPGPPSPASPNYSTVSSFNTNVTNNVRWFTSLPFAIVDEDVLYVTINGAVNFGTTPVITDIFMQISVTPGVWFDANSPYNFNPSTLVSNGNACLDAAVSSATIRKITLGRTTFTGNAYVRIGVPNNEALKKQFSGVSMSTTAPVGFSDC
jgi:hypothetical protein